MSEAAGKEAVAASEDHDDFPCGLGELDWLGCTFPDGFTVEARRRRDLPVLFIFEGEHPDYGWRYFRARRRGGADGIRVEVWDVTEALQRWLDRRHRRARCAQKAEVALRDRRRQVSLARPPAGSPTPERRRRGPVSRETIPNRDYETPGEPLNVDVHRAPDRLVAMHKRGTLTSAQLHALSKFHATFIAGGLDPARAANMSRVPGGGANGLPDAMLDAQHEVFQIYDHVGGRQCLSARILRAIAGEDRCIEDCVRVERGVDRWATRERIVGALATVADSVSGYYATRRRLEEQRRRMLSGTGSGVLSQGA